MHKSNEQGNLLMPLVIVGALLLFSLVFGFWAFAGRQDYKNNVDAKIDEAVEVANEQLSTEKDAEFAETEKNPFKSYQGPAALGTVNITYPKTWSAYINERSAGVTALNGYLHPNFVPVEETETIFAFRFQVINTAYDQVLRTFDSAARSGKATITAYRAPKVEGTLGSRITGEIATKKQGDMVLLPLRDKTIKIWTEDNEFRGDFNKVLESFTFVE